MKVSAFAMGPHYCAVAGCNHSSKEKEVKFYQIPKVRDSYKEITMKRKNLWLKRLSLKYSSVHFNTRVCSDHFVSGKPSYFTDETNPDWAPCKNLGSYKLDVVPCVKRYKRRMKFSEAKTKQLKGIQDAVDEVTVTTPEVDENLFDNKREDENKQVDEGVKLEIVTEEIVHPNVEVIVQTKDELHVPNSAMKEDTVEILSLRLESLKLAMESLRQHFEQYMTAVHDIAVKDLWSKLEFYAAVNPEEFEDEPRQGPGTSEFFKKCQHSDYWMKFYTSLESASLFETVYLSMEPVMLRHHRCALSLREQFFLTLVKLAHNFDEQDLAFRFNIGISTVSRYFQKWVNAIYCRLRDRVITWPSREELQVSMPMSFRKHFPDAVAILDCFETQIQIPHSPADQAATYSSYKSRNTAKYLISSTPHGTVNFITHGYTGRVSDQFVVRDSGIMDHIKKGDVVLADRGFTIADDLAIKGAKLVTPAFLYGRKQLSQQETETNRDISNVRIHIERIIGCLRMRFEILRGPVNIKFLYNYDEALSFYDKVVAVCCILANVNPSIVPSD